MLTVDPVIFKGKAGFECLKSNHNSLTISLNIPNLKTILEIRSYYEIRMLIICRGHVFLLCNHLMSYENDYYIKRMRYKLPRDKSYDG